jgi:thiol:disulfide interchange protein
VEVMVFVSVFPRRRFGVLAQMMTAPCAHAPLSRALVKLLTSFSEFT